MLTPHLLFTNKSSSHSRLAQDVNKSFFQPKLTVNTPGDAHEQAADRVADQVMRMREGDAPILQQMPLTPVSGMQRACAECEEEQMNRKEASSHDAGGKVAPAVVSEVLASSGGQPLDNGTRHFMESRFGQDFGQVRIHTGQQAANSAQSVNAQAYTVGADIVFNQGYFDPQSDRGKSLLAHELAHTIQQRGAQSVQRQLTSFPMGENEEKTVQRSPLQNSLTRTPYAILQRRGSTPIGTLCVRTNAVNAGLTAGHAWLSYTPTGGRETTYGTWGNRSPIGLHRDLEVRLGFIANRCTEVDATDVTALNSFAVSNNAWSLTNNCASFAARGWRQVTGESIPHTSFFIPNPSALGAGIRSLGRTLSPTAPIPGGGSSSW